jgi:hypothetical protein
MSQDAIVAILAEIWPQHISPTNLARRLDWSRQHVHRRLGYLKGKRLVVPVGRGPKRTYKLNVQEAMEEGRNYRKVRLGIEGYLSVAEAASKYHLNRQKVSRWIKEGQPLSVILRPAFIPKPNAPRRRVYLVSEADLLKFLKRQ